MESYESTICESHFVVAIAIAVPYTILSSLEDQGRVLYLIAIDIMQIWLINLKDIVFGIGIGINVAIISTNLPIAVATVELYESTF